MEIVFNKGDKTPSKAGDYVCYCEMDGRGVWDCLTLSKKKKWYINPGWDIKYWCEMPDIESIDKEINAVSDDSNSYLNSDDVRYREALLEEEQ